MRLTRRLTRRLMGRRSGKAARAGPSPSGAASVMGSGRLTAWVVLGALLVVGGTAGTVFAAGWVVHNDDERSRQAFEQSSAEVPATLQLAIHDQESLVVNTKAFILENPGGSNAHLDRWLGAVHAFERFPELKGLAHIVMVPASQLPAFARKATAVAGSSGAQGRFSVVPPGIRPFYCLVAVQSSREVAPSPPPGLDLCAIRSTREALLHGRDRGLTSYETFTIASGDKRLGLQVPIFRDGVVPATVAARRAAYQGSVGVVLDQTLVLDRALQGHPGVSVSIRYRAGSSDASFSSGKSSLDSESIVTDLHNGWTVKVSGHVTGGGVLANRNALALLTFRLALGLLAGGLMLVLITSRARALQAVQDRTAQLRGAQAQLVDSARQAGMAEIATNVLHNVGNVLNSVNVSANVVCQEVRGSKAVGLSRAVALMHEHADDLGEFLMTDSRGKTLPGYLDTLVLALASERVSIEEELRRLTSGVAHIKEIVAAQQSLAGVFGVIEPARISDLIDDALQMAGVSANDEVTVVRAFPDAGPVLVDRHRVLLILVNLVSNAVYAMQGNVDRPRQLSVRAEVTAGVAVSITVADNGEGIPPENLTRIFAHGFTTHSGGHGFGLHSSALAAEEMGGELTVHSDGVGTGAAFTLEVPLESRAVAA